MPIDRSPKARCALSRIEHYDSLWRQQGNSGVGPKERQLQEILRAAGIPDTATEAAATECLVSCGFNKFFETADVEGPRIAEERRDLGNLIAAAENFAEHCRCLAVMTRNRLLDEPGLPSTPERDAYAAGKVAMGIARAAAGAMTRLPPDRGGAPGKERLRNTIFGLAVVWNKFTGSHRGVGRSGKRAFWRGQDAEYKGPLFDMVIRVLDLEGIEYRSRAAVGAVLLDVAERARKRASISRDQDEELRRLNEQYPPPALEDILDEVQRPARQRRRGKNPLRKK